MCYFSYVYIPTQFQFEQHIVDCFCANLWYFKQRLIYTTTTPLAAKAITRKWCDFRLNTECHFSFDLIKLTDNLSFPRPTFSYHHVTTILSTGTHHPREQSIEPWRLSSGADATRFGDQLRAKCFVMRLNVSISGDNISRRAIDLSFEFIIAACTRCEMWGMDDGSLRVHTFMMVVKI